MTFLLPAYSPPSPVPSYSTVPLTAERSLEYRHRTGYQQPIDIPGDVFLQKTKHAKLVLFNQSINGTIPVYGRHLPVISGELSLDSHERVISVVLKLVGRIIVILKGGSTTSGCIVNTTEMLYDRDAAQYPCPNKLSFTTLLPTTYTNSIQRSSYLPPTFITPTGKGPETYVQIDYSMLFEVTTRSRARVLKKTQLIYIPFRYEVRDRPRYPYLPTPSPTISLKSTPEEWQINNLTIGVYDGHLRGVAPIECQLVIPSATVFGLVDFIPFHIEFFGTVKSLRHFFGGPQDPESTGTPIRVSLVHQVTVVVRKEIATRAITLGEATIRPLPPSPPTDSVPGNRESLEWEGELKVDPTLKDIRTGGFRIGTVSVEDFITLTLTPRSPDTSSLEWCTRMYPIKLVTDSWCMERL